MTTSAHSSIVGKCNLIMDIVCEARQPLHFSEIVAKTGFVKSSTHRILAILQTEKLIHYNKTDRTYHAGTRLHEWSRSVLRRGDLYQLASPTMIALSEEAGMNVALSVLDRENILYLGTVDFHEFRYASRPGDRAPLHSTAAGKIFLAFMDEPHRKATFGRMKFEKLTENTLLSPDALNEELDQVRQSGLARAVGEELLQVNGLAAPIRNHEEKVIASLSLWSLSEHSSASDVEEKADMLKSAAGEISGKLGSRPPA